MLPIFLSLTSGDDHQTTKAVAFRSLMLAFLIIVIFSVVGKVIFEFFGITLPALRMTGGLLVLLIGVHMLQGDNSNVHHLNEGENQECKDSALSVAISPLAMPILAGPGTIATAINFSARGGFIEIGVTIAAFALICVITYLLFVLGEKFVSFIGPGALGVITRMMGLILAVVGMQMVIEGIQGAFKLTM